MQRIAALFPALLFVALGVLAGPTASATPLLADYSAEAVAEVLSFDIDIMDGFELADVRLISTDSMSGSTLTPRSSSSTSDLAFTVDGLELEISSNQQTAPPSHGAPATETLAAASAPGLLSVGVLDTSVEANYETDASCVTGDPLADSQIESTAGATVEPSNLPSVLTTGTISTRSTTELVPTAGINRAVRATASGTLPKASFLGGEVDVAVDGQPELVGTATGVNGGATVDYNQQTVRVIVDETETVVIAGASQTFEVANGAVTITVNEPVVTVADSGESAEGFVAVFTVDVRVGPVDAPLATARVDLLPLRVLAIAPAGGIDCPPPAPVVVDPADSSTTEDPTPTYTGTGTPGASLNLAVDDEPVDEVIVGAGDGIWEFTATAPLALGDHTVSATQTVAGATSASSNENTFTVVDLTVPDPPVITQPVDGSTITDSTAHIVGTGEPGAAVAVSLDDTELRESIVDVAGTWTVPVTTPLVDEPHTASATQTDVAGNESVADEVDLIIDDTVAPDAPVITAPVEGSTTDTTPDIVGTGEPGATVAINIDGADIGETLVDEGGNWTFPVTTPTVLGPHTATAIQTDLAGNQSEADQINFINDIQAPDAPVITKPTEGSRTNDSTPDIAGTGEPRATVTVSIDGVEIGKATVDDDGNWVVPVTTPLIGGPHTASATQIDEAGNPSDDVKEVDFINDPLAPDAPVIIAPAEGSTTDTMLDILGIGEPGATVTISIDDATIGDALVDEAGFWGVPLTTPLVDGPHTVSATQTDLAGNQSEADYVDFMIDTLAPDAPVITEPVDGSTIADSTPDIVGTGDPGATVAVSIEGDELDEAIVDGDGDWAVPVTTPLTEGPHTASATQTDKAGRQSAPDWTGFIIDAVALVITVPAEGSTTHTTPDIVGTGERGASVIASVDGSEIGESSVDDDGNWYIPITSPLSDGPHTATATQTDLAGNQSEAGAVDFLVDTQAPNAPVITEPVDGSTITDLTPDIVGTGEPRAKVMVSIDGAESEAIVDDDGKWDVPITSPLTEGPHTASATQTDEAGNQSEAEQVDFLVDALVLVITGPADGSVIPVPIPDIVGTGESGAGVTVRVDDVEIGDAIVDDDRNWAVPVTTPLADGPHIVAATQTDHAGNESETEIKFAVDTAPPDAPVITEPSPESTISDSTPDMEGTGEPDATVTVFIDGILIGDAAVHDDGNWTVPMATPLANGPHNVSAVLKDPVGNESEVASAEFIVDAAAAPHDRQIDDENVVDNIPGSRGQDPLASTGGPDAGVSVLGLLCLLAGGALVLLRSGRPGPSA